MQWKVAATNWNGFSHSCTQSRTYGVQITFSQDLWNNVEWHLLCLEEDLLPITALEEDFGIILDEYWSASPVAEQHELGDVGVAGEGGHVQGAPAVPARPAWVGSMSHHQLHQSQLTRETGLLEGRLAFGVEPVDVNPLRAGHEEAVQLLVVSVFDGIVKGVLEPGVV